jgi:hypothetical protein
MTNYIDMELEQERGTLHGPRWLFSPVARQRINDSRKFANRIRYSDEDLLTISGNRIGAEEASFFYQRAWFPSTKAGAPAVKERFAEVNGQELLALMKLAGTEDDVPVIPHHPYRVRFEYYRQLHQKALAARPSSETRPR